MVKIGVLLPKLSGLVRGPTYFGPPCSLYSSAVNRVFFAVATDDCYYRRQNGYKSSTWHRARERDRRARWANQRPRLHRRPAPRLSCSVP